jgi:hypothetical protein
MGQNQWEMLLLWETNIPYGNDPDSFCVDHVKPQTRGGSDEIQNLVPACFSCNRTKSDKGLFNWSQEMCDKETGERTGVFYFELMHLPFPTAWEDEL